MKKSEAYERILQVAETLFVEKGYEAVTIKDIAKAAGIHHASIYHHIPGGKADLFVKAISRYLYRHQEGIRTAITSAEQDLRAQLTGIAKWLISQPPMDMVRLANSDLPSIERESAEELEYLAYVVMMVPIEQILKEAQSKGEIDHPNLGIVAGAILSSIEGLHTIPEKYIEDDLCKLAEQLIDIFIRGIAKA